MMKLSIYKKTPFIPVPTASEKDLSLRKHVRFLHCPIALLSGLVYTARTQKVSENCHKFLMSMAGWALMALEYQGPLQNEHKHHFPQLPLLNLWKALLCAWADVYGLPDLHHIVLLATHILLPPSQRDILGSESHKTWEFYTLSFPQMECFRLVYHIVEAVRQNT